SLFDLLLEILCLCLLDIVLENRRSAVHKVLCLLKAKTKNLLHNLDYLDLVCTCVRELNRNRALLFAASGTSSCRPTHSNCCSRPTELLIEDLHELRKLENRHLLDVLNDALELRWNLNRLLYRSRRSCLHRCCGLFNRSSLGGGLLYYLIRLICHSKSVSK